MHMFHRTCRNCFREVFEDVFVSKGELRWDQARQGNWYWGEGENYLFLGLSVCLSVCLSVFLSVISYVCLSVCQAEVMARQGKRYCGEDLAYLSQRSHRAAAVLSLLDNGISIAIVLHAVIVTIVKNTSCIRIIKFALVVASAIKFCKGECVQKHCYQLE